MDKLGAYGSDSDEQEAKPPAAPADDGKKKISFTLPIALPAPSKKGDEDDDSFFKRRQQAPSGGGVLSFLPPPKNPTAANVMPAKRTEPETVPEAEPDVTEPEKPKPASSSSSTITTRRPLGRLLAPSEMVPVKKVKVSQAAEATPSAPIAAPPAEASAIGPYPPPDDGGYAEYLPEPEEYLPPQEPQYAVQQQSLPNVAPPPGFGRIRGAIPDMISVNAQDLRAPPSQQIQRLTTDTIKPDSEFQLDPMFMPTSDQRRKHQLSYLVYDAKMKEQMLAEKRREAARTKAEVKSKYGW